MKRFFMIIVTFIAFIFINSCGVNETVDINVVENIKANVTPIPQPLVTTEVGSETILSEKDKENLGILIKWIYNSNLIFDGNDDRLLNIPDNIELLPTDQDKIDFIIVNAVFENLLEFDSIDSSTYSFTSDYADSIIYYAIGKNINKHQAYEDINFKDDVYYYSLIGADGAMWWPSIEIQSIVSNTEDKINVKGILKSEHDIYTNVYSYNFEAIAIANSESPFGGYTLEELYIK